MHRLSLVAFLLWASLGAQLVKNPPAVQETRVLSLGWEDPLEKEIFQYSCVENPMDGGACWATVHRAAKSWTQLRNFTFTLNKLQYICTIGICTAKDGPTLMSLSFFLDQKAPRLLGTFCS